MCSCVRSAYDNLTEVVHPPVMPEFVLHVRLVFANDSLESSSFFFAAIRVLMFEPNSFLFSLTGTSARMI